MARTKTRATKASAKAAAAKAAATKAAATKAAATKAAATKAAATKAAATKAAATKPAATKAAAAKAAATKPAATKAAAAKAAATKAAATKAAATKAAATRAPLATDAEREALRAAMVDYASGNYAIAELRFPTCACGQDRFQVQGDDTQGCACRRCVACKTEHMIGDSAEYWDEAEPEQCFCTCERGEFQVGVGFAMTKDATDVRWLYVGMRCTSCGLAGVYLDWKIDYGPSLQLMDQA